MTNKKDLSCTMTFIVPPGYHKAMDAYVEHMSEMKDEPQPEEGGEVYRTLNSKDFTGVVRPVTTEDLESGKYAAVKFKRLDGGEETVLLEKEYITAGTMGNIIYSVSTPTTSPNFHFPRWDGTALRRAFAEINWQENMDGVRKAFTDFAESLRCDPSFIEATWQSETHPRFKAKPFKAKRQALQELHSKPVGEMTPQRRAVLRRKRKKK